MSYKHPSKPRKSAILFYPNFVDVKGRMYPTGPYRKELCGTNYDGVNNYLNHLREIIIKGRNKADN